MVTRGSATHLLATVRAGIGLLRRKLKSCILPDRVSGQRCFPAHPYTVCREKDGDKIIGWLDDETALGKFRGMFEPAWAAAVEAAADKSLTLDQKLVISGYWSNLLATPPAMQALGIEFFKHKDEEYSAQRAAEGLPPREGLKSLDERFDANFIKATATSFDALAYLAILQRILAHHFQRYGASISNERQSGGGSCGAGRSWRLPYSCTVAAPLRDNASFQMARTTERVAIIATGPEG